MKKTLLISFTFFAFLLSAQSKNILSSEIRWKAYKTLKSESLSHFGTIKLKSGNLLFNGNQISGGSFIIDMNSLDAEDMNDDKKMKKILETHLKTMISSM